MTIETLVNDYKAKTSRSRQMYEEALQVMPGGNSRTTTFFDPYPFYITRGAGPRIWDADGAERLDFNGNYTSLVLGHAHASVVEPVTEQATRGISFPGPSEHEVKLAESLTKRIPSMEAVRFVNSGTEATMNAIRAARAFTGRSKIAKFEGAYHGTHDGVLVSVSPDPTKAGSRKRPKPVAYSAGVPDTVLKQTVVLPWNDADACAKILEKQGRDIAALIVDPLMANAGLLVPQLGFLERLREVTSAWASCSSSTR
jgi:glutamate-1-semialdehyde 2,1-aminomutase